MIETRFSNGVATLAMPWVIGPLARELIFRGDMIDAQTALRIGLVNRVFPKAEIEAETMKIAKRMSRVALALVSENADRSSGEGVGPMRRAARTLSIVSAALIALIGLPAAASGVDATITIDVSWTRVVAGSSHHRSRVSRTVRRRSATVRNAPDPASPGTAATTPAIGAASSIDATRKTAVAPPCSTTQSSTPSAARKSFHPCSLIVGQSTRGSRTTMAVSVGRRVA